MAVVENMSYFEVDGVRHLPFGAGSGDRIVRDFGLPNLIRFPIVADLSLAGDGETHCYCGGALCFSISYASACIMLLVFVGSDTMNPANLLDF